MSRVMGKIEEGKRESEVRERGLKVIYKIQV
jgi:hypothetical protein